MFKHIILALLFYTQFSICYSQDQIASQSAPIIEKSGSTNFIPKKELTVGDYVPDLYLENIVNYKSTTAKLSDFKGKLLILDFWATWCSPCITMFSKLDSLQEHYGSKLQILSVSSEKTELVKDFLLKLRKIKKLNPASITEDKTLRKVFTHTYLPHFVWINGEGKVIAITESKEVTVKNIDAALKDQKIDITLKKDINYHILDATVGEPLFMPSLKYNTQNIIETKKVSQSSLISTSTLTNYIEGLASITTIDSNLISARNTTILGLFRIALLGNSLEVLNKTGVKVEIPDSSLYEAITCRKMNGSRLINPGLEALEWLRQHGYCYELSVPTLLADQKYAIMLAELNRYFGKLYGIRGTIEKRNRKYLSLERITKEDKLLTQGGQAVLQQDKFSIQIKNMGINALIRSLAVPLQKHPIIIDETNYKQNIDIQLNCEISNLKALNEQLFKYDLILKEKERLLDLAIIAYAN